MTGGASTLYVGTVRDRYGDQDEHLSVLVPGSTARARAEWIREVLAGVVDELGRTGHLVEIVISADAYPVLGIGCPADDAVTAIVAYLRRLEQGDQLEVLEAPAASEVVQ